MIRLTISKRIGIAFAMMLFMTFAAGISGYWGLTRLANVLDFYKDIEAVAAHFSKAGESVIHYLLNSYDQGRQIQETDRQKVHESMEKSLVDADKINSRGILEESDAAADDRIRQRIKKYRDTFDHYAELETKKIGMEKQVRNVFADLYADILEGEFLI